MSDMPQMSPGVRLGEAFYRQEVLCAAPAMVGKLLCRGLEDGRVFRLRITETEAYGEAEDKACHASKGRTARTEIMFAPGGRVYVYLIYGLHTLLNIVTGEAEHPQAVLVRCCGGFPGPARLTKSLQIDRSFYGEDMTVSSRLWLEDDGFTPQIYTAPRVGIAYAPPLWRDKPWRFIMAGE